MFCPTTAGCMTNNLPAAVNVTQSAEEVKLEMADFHRKAVGAQGTERDKCAPIELAVSLCVCARACRKSCAFLCELHKCKRNAHANAST